MFSTEPTSGFRNRFRGSSGFFLTIPPARPIWSGPAGRSVSSARIVACWVIRSASRTALAFTRSSSDPLTWRPAWSIAGLASSAAENSGMPRPAACAIRQSAATSATPISSMSDWRWIASTTLRPMHHAHPDPLLLGHFGTLSAAQIRSMPFRRRPVPSSVPAPQAPAGSPRRSRAKRRWRSFRARPCSC